VENLCHAFFKNTAFFDHLAPVQMFKNARNLREKLGFAVTERRCHKILKTAVHKVRMSQSARRIKCAAHNVRGVPVRVVMHCAGEGRELQVATTGIL
jgi:hypothetical protein